LHERPDFHVDPPRQTRFRQHPKGSTKAENTQRIGDKNFRNFPKCGKICGLETQAEGKTSLRRGRAVAKGRRAMEPLASSEGFLFENFRLDRRGGGLYRRDEGDFVPVQIGSRGLDILGVLIARPGEVVSKDEIIAAVWPGTVVEDSNLTVQISVLRRALDRGRAQGSCIQTVPGRGYRFVAAVSQVSDDDRVDSSAIAPYRPSELEGIAGSSEPATLRLAGAGGRRHPWRLIPIFLVALAILGLAAAVAWKSGWFRTVEPPRLSFVVLPFVNLSGDRDQQYFADAITANLTTDLSRFPDSFVISQSTAFTYRNKSIDTKQIGRELGVRYVVEGGVQRSGHQVSVNVQLIDAATDAHLWAERFDRDMGDLLALQNEITARIGNTLKFELIAKEAARQTTNPDAEDFILRGTAAALKPRTRDSLAEALSLYSRALALDPQSAAAQTAVAGVLVNRVLGWMSNSPADDVHRAEGLVDQALAASPRFALAHYIKGAVLRAQNRWQEAITEQEMALSLDRNLMYAVYELGYCKLLAGSIDEVIPLVERAIRLSPRQPGIGYRYFQIGQANLLQSHIDEAISWLEKAKSDIPAVPNFRSFLSSAYALRGDNERAAVELAEARRLDGGVLFSSIAALKSGRYWEWGSPKTRALYEATYFAGLRKAGMPEK
jgi:TolB-like protein/DNA-binding winged helix-turn-helix (wHTH) protein